MLGVNQPPEDLTARRVALAVICAAACLRVHAAGHYVTFARVP